MKRLLKWTGYAIGTVAVLALGAVALVYVQSERLRSQTFEVPAGALAIESGASDSASIDEGRRLATVLGCFGGCHGNRMEGGVFIDIPRVIRLVAPSLTHIASQVDNDALVSSIRFGVKRDGTSVWGMPSANFYHLDDRHLASVIAFIRSEPVSPPRPEKNAFRFLARLGMAMGDFEPPARKTTALPPRLDPHDDSDPHALGRYMAVIACAECHGEDLQGNDRLPAPALGIVRGYDREAFETLIRTGTAIGGRDVGLMSQMARSRFSSLTERESAALYAYLSATGGLDLVAPRPTDAAVQL